MTWHHSVTEYLNHADHPVCGSVGAEYFSLSVTRCACCGRVTVHTSQHRDTPDGTELGSSRWAELGPFDGLEELRALLADAVREVLSSRAVPGLLG